MPASRLVLMAVAGWMLFGLRARAHDIPNARVDRSCQVTVEPGVLRVDYEVGLAELTLTQELRMLVGALPGADRQEWFQTYGRETGLLNAKGFLVSVDGSPIVLTMTGFDLFVEEHPRYVFHLTAEIPPRGELSVNDTNFASSEGTSRLAIRGAGTTIEGDNLPPNVEEIAIRPVWQLSDVEERRTRQVQIRYGAEASKESAAAAEVPPSRSARPDSGSLTRLLDRSTGLSLGMLCLTAFTLGAAHAIQPGHGKTLVTAVAVGERKSRGRAALLALVTTLTHTGSVLLVAFGLWSTESIRFGEIHVALARSAGFVIAAIGLWRLGRHLGGFPEHEAAHGNEPVSSRRSLIGLGVAGGLVPCWDAVGLVVLAEAVGRIGMGIVLVIVFSLGMGALLVGVGWFAARLRSAVFGEGASRSWERRLGAASGLVLSAMGMYLLGS